MHGSRKLHLGYCTLEYNKENESRKLKTEAFVFLTSTDKAEDHRTLK